MKQLNNFRSVAAILLIIIVSIGLLKVMGYLILIAAGVWFVSVAFVRPLINMMNKR